MTRIAHVAALSLLFASPFGVVVAQDDPTSASDGCAQATSTVEIVDCAAADTQVWDNRLNEAYQTLMARLPPEGAKDLRDLQRKWIAFRDASCGFDLETGTMRLITRASCLATTTEAQARFLQQQVAYTE